MAENNTVVEATWNDVQLEDSLGMEVGYRLIPMVDFSRMVSCWAVYAVSAKILRRWDFCRQWVHIRDNMDLQPAAIAF